MPTIFFILTVLVVGHVGLVDWLVVVCVQDSQDFEMDIWYRVGGPWDTLVLMNLVE
jgi:hypothetical protein